ncbi:MAG: nucleotidyltransferase domain-containing protein, partial [Promethearchaeia archaeon]
MAIIEIENEGYIIQTKGINIYTLYINCMQLIDRFSLKLLKKLSVFEQQSFTELNNIIENKNTLSNRLKFLLDKSLIYRKKGIYHISDQGRNVSNLLSQADAILHKKDYYKNFEAIPFVFRNYIQDFVMTLKSEFQESLISAILFGSIARGKWKSTSDIDIFLIFADEVSHKTQLAQRLTEIKLGFYKTRTLKNDRGEQLHHPIQLVHSTLKALANFQTLFYDIATDGMILFDRKNIGAQFIENIKQRIKRLGLKRIYDEHNNFYWQHKQVKFGEVIEI